MPQEFNDSFLFSDKKKQDIKPYDDSFLFDQPKTRPKQIPGGIIESSMRGLSSGVDQTQALGYGAAMLFGDTIGSEDIKKWGLEGYQRNMAEADANKPRIGRVEDIHSVSDFGDWFAGTVGQLAPTMATMLATGGAGGIVGRAVGKKLIDKAAAELIKKSIQKKALSATEKAIVEKSLKTIARSTVAGEITGAMAGSSALEGGTIYGETVTDPKYQALDKKGKSRALKSAWVGAVLAGAPDALPVLRFAKRFGFAGGLSEKIAENLAKMKLPARMLHEGTIQGGLEAGTELLQTIVERSAKEYALENKLELDLSPAAMSDYLNSAAAGAAGGVAFGGLGGVPKPEAGKATDGNTPVAPSPDIRPSAGNPSQNENPSAFDAGPLDANAQAEAIRAEVFGGETTPEANQGIINSIYGGEPVQPLTQAELNQRQVNAAQTGTVRPEGIVAGQMANSPRGTIPEYSGIDYTPPDLQQMTKLGAAPEPVQQPTGIPFERQSPDLGIETQREAKRRVQKDKAISDINGELGQVKVPEGLNDPRIKRLGHRKALAEFADKIPVDREKKSTEINPSVDDIMTAIAKAGGINREEATSQGIDPASFKDKSGVFGRPIFPKTGGLSMDGLAEILNQFGYLNAYDANEMLDKTMAGLSGKSIYSRDVSHATKEILNDIRTNSEGMSPKQVKNAISKALTGQKLGKKQARVVKNILDDYTGERTAPENIAAAQADRRTKLLKQLPKEYQKELTRPEPEPHYPDAPDADAVLFYQWAERALDAGADRGLVEKIIEDTGMSKMPESQAVKALIQLTREKQNETEQKGRGLGAEKAKAKTETEKPLKLKQQTETEAKAQEQAAEDVRKAKAEADSKAKADKAAKGFKLTGSGREADQAAAAGQEDIFTPVSKREINKAANEAEGHKASEHQIEANNYKKGHIYDLQGMKISIENKAGTQRRPEWPPLAHHYGDITGTIAADGDPIDVFIKKNTDIPADNEIYVINQNKQGTDNFDEIKVMLGFDSSADAKKGYLDSYTSDFDGFGSIVAVSPEKFSEWLKGDTTGKFPETTKYSQEKQYSGKIPEIKYLPVSAIHRREMDFRPETLTVSKDVAENMDYSEPVEVAAYRDGPNNDRSKAEVTLTDGHHRLAAAIQTGRKWLPVKVKAVNAYGDKLNNLIKLSVEIGAAETTKKVPTDTKFVEKKEPTPEEIKKPKAKPTEKVTDQQIITDAVDEYKTKDKVISYLNGRIGRERTKALGNEINSYFPKSETAKQLDPGETRSAVKEKETVSQEDVIGLSKKIENKYNLKSLSLFLSSNNDLKLNSIIVKKDSRRAGAGTKAMNEIIDFADKNGLRIVLSPALKDDFQGTTSRARLVKFYKRFGLVENKGRNKDFTISEGMYRDPIINGAQENNRLYSGYDPTPTTVQTREPSASEQEQSTLDLLSPTDVPDSTKSVQQEDNFDIKYKQVEVGQLNVGTTKVEYASDAAHIVAPIRKHAQETVLAVVIGEDGSVLNVIRHTKGVKDSSDVSVVELAAAVGATEGAKKVVFAHNHPTGDVKPSRADREVTQNLSEGLEGSGVSVLGHIIVGKGTEYNMLNSDGGNSGRGKIPPFVRGKRLSVTERIVRKRPASEKQKIVDAQTAIDEIKGLKTRNGLLLLNNKHVPLGVISMSPAEIDSLRATGQIPRILKALDSTNAAAGIIVAEAKDSIQNLGNYLARLTSFRTLDAILIEDNTMKSLVSKIQIGDKNKEFYSKTTKTARGMSVTTLTNKLEKGRFSKAVKKMLDAGKLVLHQSVDTLPVNSKTLYMVAWHGSPHEFEKFTTEKIGAGEGAQAYGYGLYFASKQKVAELYKKKLSKRKVFYKGENLSAVIDPKKSEMRYLSGFLDDQRKRGLKTSNDLTTAAVDIFVRGWTSKTLKSEAKDKRRGDSVEIRQRKNQIADEIDRLIKKGDLKEYIGKLYEVDLAPAEDEYLFWDKPINEQSEKVKDALEKGGILENGEPAFYGPDDSEGSADNTTGRALYESLGQAKAVSGQLRSLGIRGIKYLDGSSRAGGEGSYNYVIFSEEDVSITAKYSKQGGVAGAYIDTQDTVHLVADNLTEDTVDSVFLHEAFHGRAQEVLGDKQYARLMKRLEGLKKLAGKKGTVSKFFAEAEAAIPSETPDGDILGEFAAYAVQQYESAPRSLPQSIVTWVKDFIAGIRVGLMRLGWMPENVTEADLAAIARSSVSKFVETNTIGQSKSAMQGQPLFSRKQAEENPQNAPVGNNLGMPEETYPQKWQRWLQDSFNRVKTLQKTIKEKGGTVSPESNVHRAEELSSGKITAGLTDLEKEDMKPLLKQMKKDGITLEELDEFSMARHAPERNRYIASINPDMPDGGSGITTAEAGDILKKYADKRQALEAAAARVYAVNQKTLDRLVEGGHLKQETADEWQGRWKYYVPLKGKAGEEGIQAGRGRGFSVRGSGLLDAMGRGEGNIAESPTAHAFAQAESAIVRTEKTKVGQALVNLIRENPDPDFWTITKRTLKQFEDLYGEPFEGYEKPPEGLVEGVDYHRVKVTTKAERKLAKAEGRKPRTTVAYRPDPSYRNRDDVFSVMVGGQELLITIKDKLVAEQLMKMNSNQLNAVVAGAGQVNRYLAMINTALNPEFVITNLERDFQTAMVNLSGEQSLAMAAKVAKLIPSATKGIWQSVFDSKNHSEMRGIFEEMQAEGGTIGFFGLEDTQTKVKRIQEQLENSQTILGKSKRGILKVRDLILDANLSVENAARLAAYKVARDQMISDGMQAAEAKAKAASLSKNLTVNFNRKGELAPVLNSAYLFYNASIQGSARIFTALKHPRIRKIVAGIAVTSFALAMYNRSAGGDDEDGVSRWDKISDYLKQTNIIIMHPDGSGEFTKIKLPYGYNVFWYAGAAINDLLYGSKDKTVAKTGMNMISAVLNAFNPIQGADFLDTVTPTVLKPFEQDARNINFMGGHIRPEYPFDKYDRPDSEKHFKSTNPQLVEMMKYVNSLTGGDETHPGLVDVSPESVKHYVGWLTGGAGLTATRTVGAVSNLFSGEPIEQKNIPFIRTLGGKVGSRYDTEQFYEAIKQVSAVQAQLKIYRGTDKYRGYRADHKGIQRLAVQVSRYKRKIKHLREKRDKAYREKNHDLAREYGEQIRQKMMEFTRKYNEAIENQ